MKGTSREIFLERVRSALGRSGRSEPDEFSGDREIIRRPLPQSSDETSARIRIFTERASEVGMPVELCGRGDIPEFLLRWITDEKISTVLLGKDPLLGAGLAKKLRAGGIEICKNDVGLDQLYDEVDCGITVADAAVVATGSLVVTSSERELRLASLVPPRHLVLVPVARLIDDLLDLAGEDGVLGMNRGSRGDIPSCVTLVTGPSKTADIEGVLVTGVHGPGTVQIVLVE